MLEDDVLREVRAAREAYAQLHHFDVRAMVEDLRTRDLNGDWPVLHRSPVVPFRSRRMQLRRTKRCRKWRRGSLRNPITERIGPNPCTLQAGGNR